jgi:hypothetical protein
MSTSQFNVKNALEKAIKKSMKILDSRGYDTMTGRKYAAAASSWCCRHPATRSSRSRGGACETLWNAIVMMYDAKIVKSQENQA